MNERYTPVEYGTKTKVTPEQKAHIQAVQRDLVSHQLHRGQFVATCAVCGLGWPEVEWDE